MSLNTIEINTMLQYHTSIVVITVAALIVLSVLILENNRMPQVKKRIFLETNILIALAALVEYTGVRIGGHVNIPRGVLAAVKAADYTLTPMTAGALIALLQEKKKKSRILRNLFLGNAILQVLSAFGGWMVVIDKQNYYTHGRLYPVYMAFYMLMIIAFMVRMLQYGKSFQKQNRVSLYATILLVSIGIGLQELTGWDCRVAYLAAAFGSAFLYIHYSEFSQLRQDEKMTEQQVKLQNDPLTGVRSRFAYVEAVDAYQEDMPEQFVVFLMDINGLKVVNDTIGHEAGDELICAAAECIEASFNGGGQTYRIGGDEFVVFAGMTKEQVGETLLDLEQKTKQWSGKKVDHVSLSVGYALAAEHPECSVEELVKEADQGMYEQKKEYYRISGRDRRR